MRINQQVSFKKLLLSLNGFFSRFIGLLECRFTVSNGKLLRFELVHGFKADFCTERLLDLWRRESLCAPNSG